MEKYPLLRFTKANGLAVALALATVGLLAGLTLWPMLGPAAALAALILGILAWFAGQLVVELIRLITDVLMPE